MTDTSDERMAQIRLTRESGAYDDLDFVPVDVIDDLLAKIDKQAKKIEQLCDIMKQAQKELEPLRRLDRRVRDLLDGRCVPGVCLLEDELRNHVEH